MAGCSCWLSSVLYRGSRCLLVGAGGAYARRQHGHGMAVLGLSDGADSGLYFRTSCTMMLTSPRVLLGLEGKG
jgi:hypothetical protein